MEAVNDAIKKIEELWESIYKACKDNPSTYEPHLKAITIDDVGETVLTVLEWMKRVSRQKRSTGYYRVARSVLLSSLEQTVTALQNISAGQYNHFPTLLGRLHQTLNALFPLTVLSLDKGDSALTELTALHAEQYATLITASGKLAEEIKRCEKAEEWVEKAELSASTAETATSKATASGAAVDALLTESQESATSIKASLSAVTTNAETIEELATDAETLRTNIAKYEEQLKKLIETAQEDQETIKSLLPEATSAGLASSFADRAVKVAKPKKWWLVGFAVSLFLLCATVIFVFWLFKQGVEEDILSSFLRRFAFATPWVWSAWFCARNYGHLARLQEVYAFKETASRAFEGYKKQMLDIGGDPDSAGEGKVALVEELSLRMMKILSKDPLDVFDRKSADETPFHSLIDKFLSRKKTDKNG